MIEELHKYLIGAGVLLCIEFVPFGIITVIKKLFKRD